MKVTMIGSHLCQDTLYALIRLKEKNAELDFLDISSDFGALKEFLKVRETSPLYDAVRVNNGLGIPFFRLEDGMETLKLEEVLNQL